MFFNLQNLCSPGPQSTSLFILGTWWLSGLQCNGLGFQDWAAIFAQRLNAMSYSWFQTGYKKSGNWYFYWTPQPDHCVVLSVTNSLLLRLNWETLAVEDFNAILVGIVAVAADVVVDGRVGDSLVTALQQLGYSFSQFRRRFLFGQNSELACSWLVWAVTLATALNSLVRCAFGKLLAVDARWLVSEMKGEQQQVRFKRRIRIWRGSRV